MVSDPFGQAPRYRSAGERFNAWTLIERVPNRGWLCRCDCGKELVRWLSSITSGRSRTCGDPQGHPELQRGRPPRKAQPTYTAFHTRMRSDRGSASAHACVDCGGAARDWSYDGLDPDECTDTSYFGKPIAYSLKQEHYAPRCRPCHKIRDIRLKRPA